MSRKFLIKSLCPRILILIGLSLGAQPVFADTAGAIQSVIGYELSNDQAGQTTIHADGTLSGQYNGITFAGKWSLEGGYYCQKITRGLARPPACMLVSAKRDVAGKVIGVEMTGAGFQTFFDVNQ